MSVVPVVPFGKHKGRRLDTVDGDYLVWLLGVVKADWLRKAVQDELTRRGWAVTRTTPDPERQP
jgi:hypothetical protein